MAMYIPEYLRATKKDVEDIGEKDVITLRDIIQVHYAFYRTFNGFDGGLSLFDSLKKKLSLYYESVKHWNVDKMKEQIRNSPHPQDEFMLILDEIMTQDMVDTYGY